MKLRLPPVYDESGDIIPVTVAVDLVTAAGTRVPHSVLAALGYDLTTVRWRGDIEAAPVTVPATPEGVEIDIIPQSSIALPGGVATYYRVSYYRDAVENDNLPYGVAPAPDVWPLVQAPNVAGPVELVSLIGAASVTPADIVAGRLLTLDERAAFSATTTPPTAINAIVTEADLAAYATVTGFSRIAVVATLPVPEVTGTLYFVTS
jgi:hypothetical protein